MPHRIGKRKFMHERSKEKNCSRERKIKRALKIYTRMRKIGTTTTTARELKSVIISLIHRCFEHYENHDMRY
jgi:hypothetical protein